VVATDGAAAAVADGGGRTGGTTMRRRSTRRIRIRPLEPGEHAAVAAVFDGLSPASRQARYLAPVRTLTPAMLRALTDVDPARHVALVAEARGGRPVGLARYVVDGPGHAEVAYEVVDDWHGRGVGARLLEALLDAARRHGIDTVHATVAADNDASLALLRRALPNLRVVRHGPELEATASLSTALDLDDVLADLLAA
jgi:RimJ/RimL family protein N-acetyltransferase